MDGEAWSVPKALGFVGGKRERPMPPRLGSLRGAGIYVPVARELYRGVCVWKYFVCGSLVSEKARCHFWLVRRPLVAPFGLVAFALICYVVVAGGQRGWDRGSHTRTLQRERERALWVRG